jgi:hypothetical protein
MDRARQRRVAIVQTIDIRQQHHPLRPRRLRDARGEAIIVAEADLLGRDRIILVEHRHHPQIEQSIERGGSIEIAPSLLQIAKRDQHLRGGEPLRAQHLGPDLAQRDLAGGGGRLRILQAGAPALRQAQPPRTERDRA